MTSACRAQKWLGIRLITHMTKTPTAANTICRFTK